MLGKLGITSILGAAVLLTGAAYGDTLYFDPTNTFSGTAPAGSLQISFTDITGAPCSGSFGCVQMVVTSLLGTGENLDPGKAIYLNFDPGDASTLTGLHFALTGNTGFSQAATVSTAEDAFKPDGDGLMDILFTYTPSTKAFTTGESQTYVITGGSAIDPIFASDFTSFWSNCGAGCGSGSHLAAIHVQNTPNGGSGSAFVGGSLTSAVPEPSSYLLLGLGLVGIGVMARRRVTA